MVIYLDVLIFLNTYLCWILLNLTAALTKTAMSAKRCAAGSFLGGISSLIILIPDDVKLLSFTAMLLKILSCFLTAEVAFKKVSLKKLLILTASLFLSGAMLSGLLRALERLLKLPQIALPNGFIYIKISPIGLVLATALIYLFVLIISKLSDRNTGADNAYRVDFKIGCKAYSLDGTADTGNTARDLFSGLPVIICTGIELSDGKNLRAVPYKTVSGEGLLYAYRPDFLTVTKSGGNPEEVSALVAGIPDDGRKKAIFNPSILK